MNFWVNHDTEGDVGDDLIKWWIKPKSLRMKRQRDDDYMIFCDLPKQCNDLTSPVIDVPDLIPPLRMRWKLRDSSGSDPAVVMETQEVDRTMPSQAIPRKVAAGIQPSMATRWTRMEEEPMKSQATPQPGSTSSAQQRLRKSPWPTALKTSSLEIKNQKRFWAIAKKTNCVADGNDLLKGKKGVDYLYGGKDDDTGLQVKAKTFS